MGDSNTDDLVLAFLKRSGVDAIDDEIASIGELGSEEVYAACGHCMNVIMEERGEAQRFSARESCATAHWTAGLYSCGARRGE